MIVRIPLNEENSSVTPMVDDNPVEPADPLAWVEDFELPRAVFGMRSEIPTDYSSSHYSHPVCQIAFQVPDGDLEALRVWLGLSTATGPAVPSDTFINRMTSHVIGALQQYYDSMARASLFTRPYKIGCALRLTNGNHVCAAPPRFMSPNSAAPLMLVREPALSGNSFSTLTEIVNTPVLFNASVPAFTLPEEALDCVTHLDFFATRQAEVLTGHESVTSIRTVTYAGANVQAWLYEPIPEETVRQTALNDSSFRVIASIPIATAMQGIGSIRLPADGTSLENWQDFPEYREEPQTTEPDTTEPDYVRVRVDTHPLDMGMPEKRKKVRALSVRGIFSREPGNDEIMVELYGSHHRDRWHRVACARGPHLRLLRSAGYRWWRVAVTAPRDARIEALTFQLRAERDLPGLCV